MTKPRIQAGQEDQSPDTDLNSAVPEFTLPDASFLLYGTFSQDGFDLVITNPAADKVIVADYFSFDIPPNLVLANGAGLTPTMVKSLFPRAFGDDVLFAGPAPSGAALTEIGTITLVVGTVTVRHADGSQDTLSRGDTLFKGDVILTGAGSFVKAEMLDGTRFHLGQSGEVALDDFIYDEAAGQGQFDATIRVGGFYYKSGEISDMVSNLNRAHTTLKTPSAIIGVRGSELEGSVSPEGQTVVVHHSGILEITDINGENLVTLVEPGNTAVVILNGSPVFSSEPPAAVEAVLEQALLPPEGGNEVEAEEVADDQAEAEAEDDVSSEEESESDETEAATEADAEGESEAEAETEEGDAAGGGDEGGDSEASDASAQEVAGSGDSQEAQGESDSSEPANSEGSPQSLESLNSVDSGATAPLSLLDTPDVSAGETEQTATQVAVVVEPDEEPLPVDNPPVTQPDTLDITGTNSIEISSLLLANDDDPDSSEPLNVISASGGTGSFEVDQGSVTYFPDQALLLSLGAGQTETQIITYEVESGGLQATGTLTVTYIGENEAPVLQSETAAISEDTLLELHVLDNATDTDAQDTLTITGVDTANLTGTAEISADGQFLIYNPPQDMDSGTRTEVFNYSVSDGTATSTATVTITVTGSNDPPVIESDSSSFSVDVVSGQIEIPLSVIFSDADSASVLTVVSLDSTSSQGATLSVGSVLYDPGNIFISLSEDETGTDSFAITVEDQHGATASGTFTFQVVGANDAPIANSDSDALVENDAVSADALSGVLVNDEDPDTADTLVVSSLRTGILSGSGVLAMPGDALQGTYGTLTLHVDGSYDYQANLAAADALAAGEVAVDVFTYTVSDDALTSLSDEAELAFTITGTNDAPLLLDATEVSATVTELADSDPGELTDHLSGSGSFTFEDVDLETHTVSVQAVGSNATSLGDINVTVTEDASVDGSGLVEWSFTVVDADLDYLEEEDSLTQDYIVTVADAQGGSFDQTVTVTLLGSNEAPIANSDSDALAENDAVSADAASGVLVNDEDPDTADTLVVSSIRSGTLSGTGNLMTPGTALTGTYGTLTLHVDGSYDYQANLAAADALAQGEVAVDVFTYTVSDDALTSLSDEAELAFTITGTNDAPLLLDATEVTATVTELADNDPGELTDHLSGSGSFTFEDVDLETHTVSVQAVGTNATSLGVFDVTLSEDPSVDGSGQVAWGFTVEDADLDYLEEEEALTQDYIITVSDGQGSTFAQTVTVSLLGSYDSPNAPPYQDSTDIVYQSVVIEESYSETFLFYDVDGDPLTLSYTIPIEIDGYISFTPDVTTDTNGYTEGTMILAGLFVDEMVGDYLITVSANDGLNAEVGDTFVLSVRDPDIIVEGGAHQFVAGEAELVVSDHGDDPGLGDIELIDAGSGDRVQFMAHINEIYLISDLGSTVTLDFSDGGGYIDAAQSPGPDYITLYGDTSDLNFYNLGSDDTLINETTIDATGYNFTLDANVENNGDIHVSSSSNGSDYVVGSSTAYQQSHDLADPVYTGDFSQGESGVLEVSSRYYATYGGYMITLDLENAGSISVGATDMYGTGTAVLEVQSDSTGPLAMGSFTQTASGTLSIGGGGIVSAGSLDNEGLVVLEVDQHHHASLLLDGTYTESGTLWSTASDYYDYDHGVVNEIFLDSFVLSASGQIVLDAPLLFTNPNQVVDLRLGQVDFNPSNGALGLEGGTLILGENSDFLGSGWLGFFDIDQSRNDTGTIVIDNTFSTSNFFRLGLAGAAVTIMPHDDNAVLVVAEGTELDLYDSDVINTDLVNQGWIFVGGADNEINGDFDNSAGLLAIGVGYSTTETDLHVSSAFDNQGIIEFWLETSVPSSASQNGGYPEFNANLTSVEPWTNTGSIFIEGDVWVEDDGYGNSGDPVYDFNVNIHAEITNANTGLIQVNAGQVTIDQMTNSGTIRVIGSNADFSELSSLSGSSLTITGNLVLEETSIVELEVNLDDTDNMTIGHTLQADLIQPSTGSTDLGTLSLLFNANHNFYPDNDAATANAASMSLDLGSSYQQGANFSSVQTNLAAGYDSEWSADGGAITLQVSDGMEAVVSQASDLSQVASTDDVRIIGTITLDQASQTINSFSIEKWTPEDTGTETETIGGLHLGDTDTVAENFELIVMDDSTVAPNLELYVGAGNEGAGNDTSVLTLGGLLTVNGSLQLDEGGQINGEGSITIADEASADLEGGTLDLNLTVLQGGWVNAGASGETLELDGMGSIISYSELYLSGNLTLGIDVGNQYRTELNGGAQVSLAAGAGIIFTNEGVLGTDADDDVSFDLADNTLDTRGGEIALFLNENTYTATLSGGDGENSGIIRMDSETTFAGATSDYYDCPTLVLAGDLTLSLAGVVVVDAEDDSYDVTLDGSSVDSMQLINEGSGTALFLNYSYVFFNNLTTASDVTLANFNDMSITGVSVIEGDLYTFFDFDDVYENLALYLDDDITIRGNLYNEPGTEIWAGKYSEQLSMVVDNDFVNEGDFYFHPNNTNINIIEFGEGINTATFTNEGAFYAGVTDEAVEMELQGIIINQGHFELELASILKLNEDSWAVTHENNGVMVLNEDSVLTLGNGNTLLNGQSGELFAAADAGGDYSTIDLTSTNASLVNEGILYVGDSYMYGYASENHGMLRIRTSDDSGEVVFESGSQLNMDYALNGVSNHDHLQVTSTGSSGGVLRINGGYLNINQAGTSATTSTVMITAVSILGSFDEVGGLFLEGDPDYALLDLVQTQTSISLVAVASSEVIEGTSGADTIDMGTATETFAIAGEDDDVIVNIRSGDTAYGQAGDDTFELSAIDVKRIDGGEGIDSIVLPDVAESFIFLASTGWHGTTFDNIEVLRMDDASEQTLVMEAADISRIIDGENELVDDATALVVVGNIRDRIDLYGDFAAGEDRYAEIDGTPTLFSEVSEGDVSLYFDQNTSVYVYENDNGISIYGNAEGEVLTGTPFDETLSGRQGDDELDAGLGADIQLGGDGNDRIKFDGLDSLIDGGRGVDTATITGNVDLSGVDNLENIEILDMSDNGTADTIELNLSDVLDIVGDNSLSGYEVESDNKVLVIKGDAEDTVLIDGLGLDLISPDATDVDLFGDGELYYLYEDAGVSVYVHSDLVGASAPPQAMGLDSYIHNSPVDAFGII